MSGKLIHGVKYISIANNNDLKKKSLEDNLCFTLRDIFWHADSTDTACQANYYNSMLTNNICFEERSDSFQYKKLEKHELEKISRWLNNIKKNGWFEFLEGDREEEDKYMKFDDWWVEFINLRELIIDRLNSTF
jgi:hypothetical protein